VIGVVEPNGQELPGPNGSQQANVLERVALGRAVPANPVIVLDNAVT
jgi:hypothetical protein